MFIKEQFIGRSSIIKLINKRLCDLSEGYRQNIALLGNELTGKTWIIRYILDSFSGHNILPLYFDLSQHLSQPQPYIFTHRFLTTVLFSYLKSMGRLLPKENLARLIEEAHPFIPLTTAKIKEITANLKKDKIDIAAFREMLSVPEILYQETKLNIVIVFDEFQNLESFKIRNVFEELGKKIMMQKHTMYVFSSSYPSRAKKIIHDELSLLFGSFEILTVNSFNNKTSHALIKNRLKNKNIPDDIARFLINFTGGHPFYLDKITQHLYQNLVLFNSETLTPFIFIYSLEELLFNKWGTLHMRFQNYLSLLHARQKSEIFTLLLLIAQGKNRIKDLSNSLHKTHQDINQKLSRLIEANLLTRCGSFYSINDRLFGFWLNFVYAEKLSNLSQNYEDQVIAFRKKIEQSFLDFIEISKQDISQRLQELFTCFSNDAIKIERNITTLARFKEIKPLIIGGKYITDGFLCACDDHDWIVGLKRGDITEESVREFMEKSKEFQKKDNAAKRIIIGLEETELNARLLAKQTKILTWDKYNINFILDLYGKPRIIT